MSLASAFAQHRQGNLAEAERLYRQVLREQPGQVDALLNLGILALQVGQPQAAEALISQAVAGNSPHPSAYLNLGVAQRHLGRREEALASFNRALQLAPDNADVFNNRGSILLELQRPQEALASLERALQLNPGSVQVLNNQGSALRALQRHTEAMARFEQALALAPDSPELLANYGTTLSDLGRYEQALQCYDRALQKLRDPDLLRYRSDALLALGRMEEALAGYEQALQSQPGDVEALFSAASCLLALNRLESAQEYFRRVCALRPDFPFARGYRMFTGARLCDWTDAARERRELLDAVLSGARADVPLSFLSVTDSPAAQLQCARTFAEHRYPVLADPPVVSRRTRHERIRLAYVSADLRNHIVSRLLARVFEKHDRLRFEVHAISLRAADNHPFGRRVHAAFDRFTDVSRHSDAEVAALMRELEIDIAIDLMGFTEGQRMGIFGRRCAPVQVNYLGFPGTVGTTFMDYIIADEYVIPPASRAFYSEKVAYLPGCFHPTDDARVLPARCARQDLGLPEDALVCCSLNNSYKYNDTLFDIWARLLLAVPNSVLWLIADEPSIEARLRRRAAERGVSAAQLRFSRRVSYEDNIARVRNADLFLDTLPFNAGATASDVLWAGVPLLTCSGESFAGRMAGSLLRAVGLEELVTSDLAEYERRALELMRTPSRLVELRRKLEMARERSPLFNTESYCRNLEGLYQVMWERSQRGESSSVLELNP
jgi:protein O-GlcNAc transferase